MRVLHLNCKQPPDLPEIGVMMKRLNKGHYFCPVCHVEILISQCVPTYPPGGDCFFSYEEPLTHHYVELAITN